MCHGYYEGHGHDSPVAKAEVREEVWKRQHGDTAGQEQCVVATQHAHQTKTWNYEILDNCNFLDSLSFPQFSLF